MGLHPWASKAESYWERKLGEPCSADKWGDVFEKHPEFFRVRDGRTTLQLRHTYDKTYYAHKHRRVNSEELSRWNEEKKASRLTTRPLKIDEIELLLRTAIELHSRAIAQREENRWWRVPSLTAFCAIVSVVIGMVVQWLLSTCSSY